MIRRVIVMKKTLVFALTCSRGGGGGGGGTRVFRGGAYVRYQN